MAIWADWAAPQAFRVLDAAGCDGILVETVGVGHSEVEFAGLADTTLVLIAPGMGDGIQAAKAGILEIGDIFVVNKADRDGAPQVRRELRNMISLAEHIEGAWRPPILLTVASKGEGIDEVAAGRRRHCRARSGTRGLFCVRRKGSSGVLQQAASVLGGEAVCADKGIECVQFLGCVRFVSTWPMTVERPRPISGKRDSTAYIAYRPEETGTL